MTNTAPAAPAAVASGFASTPNEDTGSNKPVDPFKKLLADAFKIGKAQGAGDVARFDIFDIARVAANEGTLPFEKAKPGKKVGKDISKVGQFSERYIDGVVEKGGNSSKATQKNRFQTIVKWCAGPGSETWQPDATWLRAKDVQEKAAARNEAMENKKDHAKIYALAEVMLRVATLQASAKGAMGDYVRQALPGQPLTDGDIEHCVYRQKSNPDFIKTVEAFQSALAKETENQGGEAADDSFKTAAEALNALLTHLTQQFNADEEETAANDAIAKLVAMGRLVPTVNGKGFKFAA